MVCNDRPVYQEEHAAQLIMARRLDSPLKGRIHLSRPVDRSSAFPLQSRGGPYILGNNSLGWARQFRQADIAAHLCAHAVCNSVTISAPSCAGSMCIGKGRLPKGISTSLTIKLPYLNCPRKKSSDIHVGSFSKSTFTCSLGIIVNWVMQTR